ncbi:MAG: AAA family ATPase [bacterium]|nr:AAA family ATPase [bacterium]
MAKKKNFIITISGTPGSGKSTVAKNITSIFNAQRVYIGGLWRDIAKEKNMTLEELNKYVMDNPQADIDMDKKIAKEARQLVKKSIVIVEGRVQFLFLPESVKIFIKANPEEAAKRVWQEIQNPKNKKERNEANITSLAELKTNQKERASNDIIRYKKIYHIDYTNESQYDFILDTSNISAEEATRKVTDFIDKTAK